MTPRLWTCVAGLMGTPSMWSLKLGTHSAVKKIQAWPAPPLEGWAWADCCPFIHLSRRHSSTFALPKHLSSLEPKVVDLDVISVGVSVFFTRDIMIRMCVQSMLNQRAIIITTRAIIWVNSATQIFREKKEIIRSLFNLIYFIYWFISNNYHQQQFKGVKADTKMLI